MNIKDILLKQLTEVLDRIKGDPILMVAPNDVIAEILLKTMVENGMRYPVRLISSTPPVEGASAILLPFVAK